MNAKSCCRTLSSIFDKPCPFFNILDGVSINGGYHFTHRCTIFSHDRWILDLKKKDNYILIFQTCQSLICSSKKVKKVINKNYNPYEPLQHELWWLRGQMCRAVLKEMEEEGWPTKPSAQWQCCAKPLRKRFSVVGELICCRCAPSWCRHKLQAREPSRTNRIHSLSLPLCNISNTLNSESFKIGK